MYAHVITNHLSNDAELAAAGERGDLSDQDARTVAYQTWNSNPEAAALRKLGEGHPFDTCDAMEEALTFIEDDVQADLFYNWLVQLETLLLEA